jgi:hypothetical protein
MPKKAKLIPRNKILSVSIKRMVDDSPDTSWLGEYSARAESEFAIDRAHSEDCAINTKKQPNVPAHTLYECGGCDCLHPWEFDGDCRDDSNRYGDSSDYAKKMQIANEQVSVLSASDREDMDTGEYCDCGNRGDMDRNQYRFFNPGSVDTKFNPAADWIPADVTDKESYWREAMRKNARQDYERMEKLNRGDFCFIGIRAEAKLGIPQGKPQPQTGQSYLLQNLSSGGLWGIESDSDTSYIESEEKNQLDELRDVLLGFGFSRRAIATAFKNVERKDV